LKKPELHLTYVWYLSNLSEKAFKRMDFWGGRKFTAKKHMTKLLIGVASFQEMIYNNVIFREKFIWGNVI